MSWSSSIFGGGVCAKAENEPPQSKVSTSSGESLIDFSISKLAAVDAINLGQFD